MKRYTIIIFVLFLLFSLPGFAEKGKHPYESIPFEQVFYKFITRPAKDNVHSGYVKTEEGLKEFCNDYDVDIEKDVVNFKKQMLVFGITDRISTRVFQFLRARNGDNTYLLDYYDTGVYHRLKPPPEGKKYSVIEVFAIARVEKIDRIDVKNYVLPRTDTKAYW